MKSIYLLACLAVVACSEPMTVADEPHVPGDDVAPADVPAPAMCHVTDTRVYGCPSECLPLDKPGRVLAVSEEHTWPLTGDARILSSDEWHVDARGFLCLSYPQDGETHRLLIAQACE